MTWPLCQLRGLLAKYPALMNALKTRVLPVPMPLLANFPPIWKCKGNHANSVHFGQTLRNSKSGKTFHSSAPLLTGLSSGVIFCLTFEADPLIDARVFQFFIA
jgi:hypothetical protein